MDTMNESLEIEYVEDTPKQENLYDCGIYVICFAEAIVEYYLMKDGKINDLKDEAWLMFAHINPLYITDKRLDIRNLLLEMIHTNSSKYEKIEPASNSPTLINDSRELKL